MQIFIDVENSLNIKKMSKQMIGTTLSIIASSSAVKDSKFAM